ncbi:hypothetical protein Nepgr_013851 [Nepenthes gracilis]|uniref:Uncharacterized protein n=1 Tax=Nepenthes gracilis TaxID=150966 RepID=A0AAD3SJK3_NEPGR|nr:hypothetical protein Nepgr_013851 [Nepenthes gracilis]
MVPRELLQLQQQLPKLLQLLRHRSSQLSPMQSQHSNGVGLNISGGLSNVKLLSKSQDSLVFNSTETFFPMYGRTTFDNPDIVRKRC